jgi:phenylalanyl-tRNA synthetase beta chain
MKAPLSWLREYVEVDLDPEELASRLAMTGTEVERVDVVGVRPEEDILERFVVGKVLSCEKHPNADKLSVCVVDVGEETPRTIVCGAPNVAASQTVPVCLPGAVMPNGFEIKQVKLRGVVSSGMIMSEEEMGFSGKSAGILELPEQWEAGELLVDRLPITEYVLEVEVTPNRPDCLSIRGLAREIAAVTEADFDEDPAYPFTCGSRCVDDDVQIEVWDPDLCPRYAARVIRGVEIAESPPWLKARIMQAGMRPISNVVDITNYVMWTVGQPMHAFDLDTVAGGKLIARRATPGEPITTLDGNDRVLTDDMLVIADAEKPSVIAGIMGSLESEITDATVNILLEAANFNRTSILRTSSALSLRSESSTRFEKGLDPNLVIEALDMACMLITEICGGVVSEGTIDVAAVAPRPWVIPLRPSRVEHVLGKLVAPDEIEVILGRLGCNVEEREDFFEVSVPTFRLDLEREIDLVEEVARIHGLNNLPSSVPGRTQGRGGLTAAQKGVRLVEEVLTGCGLDQVLTYSFIEPGWAEKLRLSTDDARRQVVTLANPLSQDQSVLRCTLLPGLLGAAARNVSRRESRVHVFEVGKTFHPTGGTLPLETSRIGFLLLGEWEEASWRKCEVPTDFFLGKGVAERVLTALRVEATFGRALEPFLHPGRSAAVTAGGRAVGWLGEVHPLVLQAFDLPAAAVACELDADALLEMAPGAPVFEDLLTYPSISQDLALVVDRETQAADVVAAVKEAAGPLLHTAKIFDVYEGEAMGAGKKSLALSLEFLSPERTLSEAEINDVRGALLQTLHEAVGAELRS